MNMIRLKSSQKFIKYLAISICSLLIALTSYSQKNIPAAKNQQRNTPAEDYLQALLRFEPWAESVWKDYPKIPGSGYFGDGATEGNGGMRGTLEITFSYYVLIRAFPDSPESKHRLKRVEEALRYAVETHRSGPSGSLAIDGKKWGVLSTSSDKDNGAWQANAWAAELGFVAAMLEKELDPEVIKGCKRVVIEEAECRSKIPPASRYRRNTASEENGWQSNILVLAPAWLHTDPRAEKWIEAAKLYMANTYSVPADSTGPLKEWIHTQTMFPSFTLENHGFFHPSYEISGIMSLADSYMMAEMINPKLAQELKPFIEHNVSPVWDVSKGLIMDTGDLAFPSGMDWSLHQFEDVSCLAWMAAYFRMPEALWGQLKVSKQILHRQTINGDGRFVGESCRSGAGGGSTDGFYVEAVQAVVVSLAYLQNEIGGFPVSTGAAPKDFISHYSDIGLIFHRSATTLTTISYGSKIMSLVYPLNGTSPNQQFSTSPNTKSMIGTDGKATLLEFKTTARGFSAEFSLTAKKDGRNSRMIVVSEPNVVIYFEIPSDTARVTLSDWFLTAIENHPMTGGTREVIWEGKSLKIKNRSGATSGPINTGWVNIDNWMGYISVTKGSLIYSAPTDYNREGAAEDALVFRPQDKKCPRATIVLPSMDANKTKSVYKSLKWKLTDKECELSFTMPDGRKETIKVPLNEKK